MYSFLRCTLHDNILNYVTAVYRKVVLFQDWRLGTLKGPDVSVLSLIYFF